MSQHTPALSSLQSLSGEKIVKTVEKGQLSRLPEAQCKIIFCDVKRDRRKLEKLISTGHKVHVNIRAVLTTVGNDDGVSTVFEADASEFEITFVE